MAYRKWRAENPVTREEDEEPDEQVVEVPSYDDIEQKAIEGLQQYINAKNPYEFQELVAALLRGMGYYTPFVAPKGKDGGVDEKCNRCQVYTLHSKGAIGVRSTLFTLDRAA